MPIANLGLCWDIAAPAIALTCWLFKGVALIGVSCLVQDFMSRLAPGRRLCRGGTRWGKPATVELAVVLLSSFSHRCCKYSQRHKSISMGCCSDCAAGLCVRCLIYAKKNLTACSYRLFAVLETADFLKELVLFCLIRCLRFLI